MHELVIRARAAADLDECVVALRAVHDADGYPMNWPADPHGWLTPPGLLHAWVAETPPGVVAGHVAVQQVANGSVELSRLFVTPAARRRSVATALMRQASEWAAERGYRLSLNVTDEQRSAAVAFYEAAGWRHTHTDDADWTSPEGRPVRLRHYVPVPEEDERRRR